MLDTGFGEVCIKEVEGENYCEAYGGDNYDDYICDVECTLKDSDEVMLKAFHEALNQEKVNNFFN